ncbi:MAG: hypothetical protein K9G44_01805 [Melioribacteraceae bacterium]|nr:hypothetical protein [Melioribacteraceae bacterium]
MPGKINLFSPKASFQEARVGILYYPSDANLKVDIGNSLDILNYSNEFRSITISTGIDFFAYAWSKTIAGNRLQISALDGFFGGHLTVIKKNKSDKIYGRFRFIHNSAHLVDGNWNSKDKKWRDDYEPIPYTKDFAELQIGTIRKMAEFELNFYSSFSYATLVRPASMNEFGFNAGSEIYYKYSNSLFGKPSNVFIAYHFGLEGKPNLIPTHNILIGNKFGEIGNEGVVLYLSYLYGNTPFNEFFLNREERFGIGFFVEFL